MDSCEEINSSIYMNPVLYEAAGAGNINVHGETPLYIAASVGRRPEHDKVIDEILGNCISVDYGGPNKEIIDSLEDVGSAPFDCSPLLYTREKNKEIIPASNDNICSEEIVEEIIKDEALDKARESHLVVAALIATVTFAAAFTLPGGYKSDQGTAILAKKAAFMIFVISDAISLILSILAVFIHFLLAFYSLSHTTRMLFVRARLFTMIGMGTMIIAFITGTYVVLEPVLGLAISICLIGLSFFLLMCIVFWIIGKDLRH